MDNRRRRAPSPKVQASHHQAQHPHHIPSRCETGSYRQSRGKWSCERPLLISTPINYHRPNHYLVPQARLVQQLPPLRGRARAGPSPMTTSQQTRLPSLPTPIHGCTSCTYGNWGRHGSRTTGPETECSQAHCGGAQSTVVRWTRCLRTLGPSVASLSYRG